MTNNFKEEILNAMTSEFESINKIKSRILDASYYNIKPILKELMEEGKVQLLHHGKQDRYRKIE